MKKLFFYLAAVSVLFAGCKKDKDKDGGNKLPSKMTYTETYSDDPESYVWFKTFEYDGQNRLTKRIYDDGSYDEYSYNSDNTLSGILGFESRDTMYNKREFAYSGNLMFIKTSYWYSQGEPITWHENMDTLTLVDGRVTKWTDSYGTETFTYNANGNITHREYVSEYSSYSVDMEYNDIKSIFRHTNTPDWLLCFDSDYDYSKNGNMLKTYTYESGGSYEYTYETSGDYVSKRTYVESDPGSNAPKRLSSKAKQRGNRPAPKGPFTYTEVVTYEYVNAK